MRARLLLRGLAVLALLSVGCDSEEGAPGVDRTASGVASDRTGGSGGVGVTQASGGEAIGGDAVGGMGIGEGGAPPGGAPGALGCVDRIGVFDAAPERLSDAGLYTDIRKKTIAPHMLPYEPRFKLWSDGAKKSRWLYLPECGGPIDASKMDAWEFPVGTTSFKQFVVDGVLTETRMIQRTGSGPQDWLYAVYVWDEKSRDAIRDDDGVTVERAGGGTYSVPSVVAGHCARCHGPNSPGVAPPMQGLPARLLGINAVDMSHDGPGLNMKRLSHRGRLSHPAPQGFLLPGTRIETDALGYLHANCGFCHNDSPLGQDVGTDYFLRLKSTDSTLEETGAYRTAVNQPISTYGSLEAAPCSHRIFGSDVMLSCIHERMGLRPINQMPPLATERVDVDGLAQVAAWIAGLEPPTSP